MITVADLIEYLSDYPQDAEVRLAIQPSWPFEHSLSRVEMPVPSCPGCAAEPGDDHEEGCDEATDRVFDPDMNVVYLAEGRQIGYLPGMAREAIGW